MRGLLEPGRHNGSPVTWSLTAAMLVVSLPTMVWPRLNFIFGGIGEIRHPWQVFASAFEHGWPGFPLIVHLILNLLLMASVAVWTERLLGSARFLGATLLAILFYWVTRLLLYPLQANGSSVFIWSYAPLLLGAILETKRIGGPFGEAYEHAKTLLFIMWAVVTVAMAGLLIAAGVPFWTALLYGNAFHFSGTLAGFVALLAWRGHLRRRVRENAYFQSKADRAAAWVATAIPAFFGVILVLAVGGWI